MHIAVVVPAFNVAAFLRECLLSVLAQTHADWSVIVVDDGSTDGIMAVASGFTDRRMIWLRQVNAGVSAARNAGLSVALALPEASERGPVDRWPDHPAQTADGGKSLRQRADVFLFLDGDDWLAPQALAALSRTLADTPRAVAVYGAYVRVGRHGVARPALPPSDGQMMEKLLTRNLFANGGHLLIRREAVEATEGFRRDLCYGEDWEYWTRLAQLGDFVALRTPAPVLFVRERSGSAYLSNAIDPEAYQPAIEAIYRNAAIAGQVDQARLASLRRRTEAETAWTVGRELIRHGRRRDGRRWLRHSIRAAPSLKRLLLMVLSWPRFGPFRPYGAAG